MRQSLGAVLLLSGDLEGAETAFRASLRQSPHNGWALYGLAEVYKRQGKADAEAELRRRLQRAWAGGQPDLARL